MVRRGKRKGVRAVVARPTSKALRKAEKKELTRLGTALRTLGGLGGGFIGNLVGDAEAGKGVGRSIGASISKWLGSGDYTVSHNTLLTPSGTVPMMHNTGQTVVVRHKEFVTTVFGSETFSVQSSLALNPGLEGTFPWLSRLAACFQEYRIRGMVFHYVPSSGDAIASTNPALGTVMFQTSYRSTDVAPSSKLELLNEYWASENVPSQAFCHPIECDPKENPFNVQYVRTAPLPTGENQLMYDLGVTHVAVSGQQVTGKALGDVWVTYEVELKKPLITSNVTSTTNFCYVNCDNSTPTNWFAGTQTPSSLNNILVGLSTTGRTVTFPRGITGLYQINFSVWPTGGMNTCDMRPAVITPTVTNCVLANYDPILSLPATGSYNNNAGGGAVFYSMAVLIADQSLQASISIAGGTWTLSSGTAVMQVSITQRV